MVSKIYRDSNRSTNNSQVYIGRLTDARLAPVITWSKANLIPWSDYRIIETDMRQKTATFTSPFYFDLTTGVYCILINSLWHENFSGEILKVDYDENTNLYTYQCQDWSRSYQSKFTLINGLNKDVYWLLQFLISRGNISTKGNVSKTLLKKYKNVLSGLRPKSHYSQGLWGSIIDFNPMTDKKQMIIKDKSYIEVIRDLIYGTGAYIDIYFSDTGVLQIEPYHKEDWLSNGLYLTTPELANRKFTFDTTNVITGVTVNSNDNLSEGRTYGSTSLTNLNLAAFFGTLYTTANNPNKETTGTTTKITKQSTTKSSKVGSGINVFMNTDNIKSKSYDKQLLNDIAKLLRKKGYSVTTGGIGPNYHYSEINKVKKNGIYFTLYGGRCAGTLKEQCYSSHYHSVLKKKNAKMVVGFYKKHLTDAYLPRAHDWSNTNFKGWDKPRSRLLNAGIGIAEGNSAKEIVASFPGFKKETKKTVKTKTNNSIIDVNSAVYINNEKNTALEKITDSVRDLLTLTITLPLGNPVLKNVHTNMFLWTELPREFQLANFEAISEALNGVYSRWSDYVLNRWYVENVTINNNAKTGGTIELKVNPFASTLRKYRDNMVKYTTDYRSAISKNSSSSSSSDKKASSTVLSKRSDGKTHCNDSYDLSTRKGRNNIKNLKNKSENKLSQGTIGKTGTNYANYVKNCKNAKEIYKKLCRKIPAKVPSYQNCKYKCATDDFNHYTDLNCAGRSRLFKACCDTRNIPCVIYHVENHYLNGVKINGKWETVDLCYRAGITHKEFNSAGFNK